MNILVVTNLYPPNTIGGYEIACADTVRLLSQSGHHIYVLTSHCTHVDDLLDHSADYTIDRSLLLHTNWSSNFRVYPSTQVSNANIETMQAVLAAYKPNAVYCWNLYGLGALFVNYIASIHNVPKVLHLMDLAILSYMPTTRRQLYHLLNRWPQTAHLLIPHFDHVIFISHFLRQRFLRHITHHSTSVLYPPIAKLPKSTSSTPPESSPNRSLSLAYVGQLEEHKGIFHLCQQLYEYTEYYGSCLALTIYTFPPNPSKLRRLSRYSHFINCRVGLDREQLLSLLSSHDLGIFPSLWEEPFGISQLELMSVGIPVLSSGRGGSSEVGVHLRNILYYNPSSRMTLFDILHLIRREPFLLKEIGLSGQRNTIERFCPTKYLENLDRTFNRIAK